MNIKNNTSGFLLTELIFAIFFLTVIVFGIISLQTSNLTLVGSQENEIQAHFLANQGVAIVDAMSNNDAQNNLPGCLPDEGTCAIQFNGSDEYLYQPGATETIDGRFDRIFELVNTDPNSGQMLVNAYQLIVTVSWNDNLGSHQVQASKILF